jgi:uncharacterized membrane protein
MNTTWKKLVLGIAPTLGAALLGPMGGAAVKVLAEQVLGTPDATEADVAAAMVQGLSPEQVVALREADSAFKVRMRELDIDVMKLNHSTELAYVEDVGKARTAHAGDRAVFWLGIAVLSTFAVLMGVVLVGCFYLLTGQLKADPAVAAMVAGMIGTVVGYVAANAQQVTSYFFGSSRGSNEKTSLLAGSVEASIKQLGLRP